MENEHQEIGKWQLQGSFSYSARKLESIWAIDYLLFGMFNFDAYILLSRISAGLVEIMHYLKA